MKTQTKQNAKSLGSVPKKQKAPRTTVENRDLNTDDQSTNAPRDEDWDTKKVTDVSSTSDLTVEDEQDRETKRKLEDSNPDEIMK